MSFKTIPLFLFLSVQVGTKLYTPGLASADAKRYTLYSSGWSGSSLIVKLKPDAVGEFNTMDAIPVLNDLDLSTESLTESC